MEPQKVIFSQDLRQSLTAAIAECPHDKLFVLCDRVTHDQCLPLVATFPCMQGARAITIDEGDINKSLAAVSHVWDELQQHGATRHSLMVNIGGGMVTDLGGFAAATFKRGLAFINIPTTLLAMVDASVGGKTGINYGGLKNEIGVFCNARSVIIDTVFLHTLDRENLLSGYAEMLKHGLIDCTDHWAQLLLHPINPNDPNSLSTLLSRSVAVKQRIVTEDPTEQGLRKALNLGHTAGHAFESLSLERARHPATDERRTAPILHGYAVAYGLVVELYLCCVKAGFPHDRMRQTAQFIKEHYGRMTVTCDDYPHLLELMHHDKKNTGSDINFTLLADIGDIRINQTATEDDIKEALDFYREY
ncbi:MAG: 3-dehydroquinate synthase [Prevotella sp.]|nr:3-dehydroquinate synthase [Prevotella sp.]